MNAAVGLPDRWLTDWQRSPRMPFYTRANATARLRDGMLLAVNGTAGTVTVVAG